MKAEENMLLVMERSVKQRILEISFHDHIDYQILRQINGVEYIFVRECKYPLVDHVIRAADDRRTARVTSGICEEKKLTIRQSPKR